MWLVGDLQIYTRSTFTNDILDESFPRPLLSVPGLKQHFHDASIRAMDDDEHYDEGGNSLLQVSNLPYLQMPSDDVTRSKPFPSRNETTKAYTKTDNHNKY
jgi:hypothetical protein